MNVFCLSKKLCQGGGPRGNSICQSVLFYCMDDMDKKYKSLVIWLLFQCSFRDPSFSFPSDAICSYSLLRIWKAHSKPAHFHVFLQALLTFPNLYLCASFRLSTVAGRSTFKYLLGYSFFFQNNFKVYLTMKFTRKLGNILTAGAGTISYDVEQYYIFVSFFLFFIFFLFVLILLLFLILYLQTILYAFYT